MTRLALLALLAVCLGGCPPSTQADKPVEVCTKVGERCQFAPGKLGTCVAKDGACQGAACFSCQSQH